jgi:hypothetical protein
MSSINGVSPAALSIIHEVARVAKATKESPELRQELLGRVAKQVGNGDYIKAELTAQTAEALAKASSYQPGQLLNKIV